MLSLPNMTRDPWERRRKFNLALGVLAVGIVISGLLAVALFFMGQTRPRY
jgi:hypothetical protein